MEYPRSQMKTNMTSLLTHFAPERWFTIPYHGLSVVGEMIEAKFLYFGHLQMLFRASNLRTLSRKGVTIAGCTIPRDLNLEKNKVDFCLDEYLIYSKSCLKNVNLTVNGGSWGRLGERLARRTNNPEF